MNKTLKASQNPVEDLERLAYSKQPAKFRMYVPGYESLFEKLPVIELGPDLNQEIQRSEQVMQQVSNKLRKDGWHIPVQSKLEDGEFQRTIIGMEAPTKEGDTLRGGSEIAIGHWGAGTATPIHGHSAGYMYEEILKGLLRIKLFRLVDEEKQIVRPVEMLLKGPGVTISKLTGTLGSKKRDNWIHILESVVPTLSLHYFAGHTTDGRDSKFVVENFSYLSQKTVERISPVEAISLQPGEVIIFRSAYDSNWGDSFMVSSKLKEDGEAHYRMIPISDLASTLLDQFDLENNATVLQLRPETRDAFLSFHGIIRTEQGIEFLHP